MKKSVNSLFLISLVIIISLSLVSAFSFSDFWNKITGKTTGNETTETCVNADGSDAKTKGTCISYQWDNTINDYIHLTEEDSCVGGDGGDSLYEWGCMSTGACQRNTVSCANSFGSNYVCSNGACVIGTGTNNPTPTCTEFWACSEWNLCANNNLQTRTCTDVRNCGTTIDKPIETQTCSSAITCTETDKGDFSIKGTAINSSGSYIDYCDSNNRLILYEYWCGATTGRVSIQLFDCESVGSNYVCSNGACTYDAHKTSTTKTWICNDGVCVSPNAPTPSTTSTTNQTSSNTTKTTTTTSGGTSSSGAGGGGGGGGSSSGASTVQNPSTTYSSSATSDDGVKNIPITVSSSGEGGFASKYTFNVNSERATITGSDGVTAVSSIQVSTDEGKAYATKEDGSKQEIKIDPTTAINSVKESTNSNSTEEVKIVEYEDKVVYEINVEKPVKIVALVPAKMSVKTKVDVENGDIVNIKKPWWSFLAKED